MIMPQLDRGGRKCGWNILVGARKPQTVEAVLSTLSSRGHGFAIRSLCLGFYGAEGAFGPDYAANRVLADFFWSSRRKIDEKGTSNSTEEPPWTATRSARPVARSTPTTTYVSGRPFTRTRSRSSGISRETPAAWVCEARDEKGAQSVDMLKTSSFQWIKVRRIVRLTTWMTGIHEKVD